MRQLESTYAQDPRYQTSQAELIAQIQQQPNSDLIRWWHDSTDYIEQLYRDLTDAKWDGKLKAWVPNEKTRMVNDEGIKTLLMFLRSHVSKGIKLSNFDEMEILSIMADVMQEVIMLLWANHARWEIDKNNLGIIRRSIQTQIQAELNRAYNQGERRFIKGSFSTEESKHSGGDGGGGSGGKKRMLGLF